MIKTKRRLRMEAAFLFVVMSLASFLLVPLLRRGDAGAYTDVLGPGHCGRAVVALTDIPAPSVARMGNDPMSKFSRQNTLIPK